MSRTHNLGPNQFNAPLFLLEDEQGWRLRSMAAKGPEIALTDEQIRMIAHVAGGSR